MNQAIKERHFYTQDELDELYDIYLRLREFEPLIQQLDAIKQDIRDELIPGLTEGDIIMRALPDDLDSTLQYEIRRLESLIRTFHNAGVC